MIMIMIVLFFFFFFLLECSSTLRRAAVEPAYQFIFVFIKEVNVGLDHFEALQQGAAAGTDVDVAEECLNTFKVEWVVEVRYSGHDEPADGEGGATER